ncbi:MAG: imidazole glycerol phosphate synthase subunit HisH [Bryobacteraceae bacterium]|nr:imidazole glycerol phosphate synthase subunit HisH [Solibacteraceae bacterium]MCO5349692.1 imidazole glycerol phosphate synthase subunit HisH [Bryobacteraceae bacterium]
MITIVDYGAGNLRSVQNTLAELGARFEVTRTPEGVAAADKLILPGVGHSGQMLAALDELNLRPAILDRIAAGVPFLGICLGMQALFDGSDEAPEQKGLSLFNGRVARFPLDARVPHMGWNEIVPAKPSLLLRNLGPHPYLYFAHSYYCPITPATAATCEYTVPYTAALEQDNVFGVQFHPEKSGPLGLRIVANFLEV